MFTTEVKSRLPQSQLNSARNSKKLLNNGQTVMASKMKNGITISAQSKSKYTLSRNSKVETSNQSLVSKITIAKRDNRNTQPLRKSNIPITSVIKPRPVSKVLMTSRASLNNRKVNNRTNQMPTQETEKNEPVQDTKREISDMAIQTNESEILNHTLIIGDLKIVAPSKFVSDEIDKLRRDMETKKLLKTTRNFEEHALRDEQHLDDLIEFLDKSFITRRPHKLTDNNLDEDRKLIASMDELLQRERPKTESITDIRSRIKHKEQELLSLFDHFQKKTELFAKTNA
ncbi:uncharacterized protein LOC135962278 [Calliphora vicina]|uniref:uncharacterized protein LOC135962278 n=1 Tax=Calliphora vicina TaxID=7373 RepID=UPI00325AAF5D